MVTKEEFVMAKNLATKILEAHLVEGELKPGAEISIRIDHTLLQDATGNPSTTICCRPITRMPMIMPFLPRLP